MNFFKSILRILRSLIFSLLLIFMVVFMVDNREIITINTQPLPFEIETRVFVMMLSCFALGVIFGVLICSPRIVKSFFVKIADRQKIKKLERQLNH